MSDYETESVSPPTAETPEPVDETIIEALPEKASESEPAYLAEDMGCGVVFKKVKKSKRTKSSAAKSPWPEAY